MPTQCSVGHRPAGVFWEERRGGLSAPGDSCGCMTLRHFSVAVAGPSTATSLHEAAPLRGLNRELGLHRHLQPPQALTTVTPVFPHDPAQHGAHGPRGSPRALPVASAVFAVPESAAATAGNLRPVTWVTVSTRITPDSPDSETTPLTHSGRGCESARGP